eukprot:SAG11_NODE_2651_length_3125_cov_2.178453_3_plen_255_part_00
MRFNFRFGVFRLFSIFDRSGVGSVSGPRRMPSRPQRWRGRRRLPLQRAAAAAAGQPPRLLPGLEWPGGGGGKTRAVEASFATVGEKLVNLRGAEDVARFARTIEATRTVKGHALNDHSSRSHCLVKVHLVRQAGAGGQSRIRLLFVDLAGSERTKKTGVEGSAKAEAVSINGSLSALGRVIKALGGKRGGHVPYRDAPLTMLLRDSLGGKSCTTVVINVAAEAEHREETVCSLRFGQRMVSDPTIEPGGRRGYT